MKNNYIYHSTYYDIELLRRQTLALNEAEIDFKVVQKSTHQSSKAPSSIRFEAEIHIMEQDFAEAEEVLKEFME